LREDHRPILIPTGEAAQVCVSTVSAYAFLKFFVRQIFYALRQDGTTCIHAPLFPSCRKSKNGLQFQIIPDLNARTMLSRNGLRRPSGKIAGHQ
jgi:hypothetical protein